jgi:hypothetical protein
MNNIFIEKFKVYKMFMISKWMLSYDAYEVGEVVLYMVFSIMKCYLGYLLFVMMVNKFLFNTTTKSFHLHF